MQATGGKSANGFKVLKNCPYVENGHPQQVLDLYLPDAANEPVPLVLYLHGGGLTGGTKDWAYKEAVVSLIPSGYAVASVDYRFVTQAPFPAPLEDCRAALYWLKGNARRLGIDPERIGVWGYSAGGLLAGLLAAQESRAQLQAAVIWAGRCDLTRTDLMSTKELEIVSGYLRGPVQTRLELARQASPISYLGEYAPPFLIIHGKEDLHVNEQQAALWEQALRRAGVEVTVELLPETTHDIPANFDFTRIRNFFDRTLCKENSRFL